MDVQALLAKCLAHIPPEYPRLDTEEATLLNYLARMEDLHAAFPRMGKHAAQPYSACDLIPHQKGDSSDVAGESHPQSLYGMAVSLALRQWSPRGGMPHL